MPLSDYGKRYFEQHQFAADAERNDHAAEDIPLPPEPPEDGRDGTTYSDEPTTWEPIDLGPYLRGEVERPQPNIGVARSDGLRFIYPGREHAILGETECGKTWLALASVAAELNAGNHVVYVHYEESDPGSTIERLRLLGVADAVISARLRFIAPAQAIRAGWLNPLLAPAPTLVVHDGVNEAMALHSSEIMKIDGWASFRQQLVVPFKQIGAAVVSCDHVPMNSDGSRRDAYGTVHKGNVLDGARLMLVNATPFGRRLRGASHVFVTKDRPGHLRAQGKPSKTPGITYMGTLVVDDSQTTGPDFVCAFYAPKADDESPETDPAAELADTVHEVLAAMPDRKVASMRMLWAQMRKAGHKFRNTKVMDAVDDLIAEGLVVEVIGKRGAKGYQAVATASQEESA